MFVLLSLFIPQWWQTESGWPIVANPRGLESIAIKDGSASVPVPGWDVRVVDDEGHELPRGVQGNLVVRLPIPPGGVQELWGNRARFEAGYMNRFPGYYDTSDAGLSPYHHAAHRGGFTLAHARRPSSC